MAHPGNPPKQPDYLGRHLGEHQTEGRTRSTWAPDRALEAREHVLDPRYPATVIIDLPEGVDPIMHVWGEMVPHIGVAASRFSQSVYAHTTLGLREFEAARLRIAQINGCVLCQDWRTERDGQRVEETFPDAVAAWRTTTDLDERGRLAAEYAERFALDHHGLDEDFWGRMRGAYSDAEIVELSMCLGSWIAFGRLNRVLGLDTACRLPSTAH